MDSGTGILSVMVLPTGSAGPPFPVVVELSHLVILNCRWFSIGIRHDVGFLSGRGDFGGSEVGLKMFSIVGVQNKRFA